jgi:hypothetical protein
MTKKGYPVHLLQVTKSLYEGTAISVEKGALATTSRTEIINESETSLPHVAKSF